MTCFITSQKLCTKDDCDLCFEKSFVSHEKSKYWNYEKNNNLNPRNIFKNCHNKFYFNCDKCNHSFSSNLANVNKGRWCPYCANPPKKLCDKDDCQICFEKSFISHDKSKFFNIELNNNINPRNVFKNCNKIFWFNCSECNHNFEKRLNEVNRGGWCPYCCSPPQKLCNKDDCDLCFEKSFASYEKSKFWNYELNNNINPRDVFKSSHDKFYFNCEICNHSFNASLGHINDGTWCPYCANRKLCENNDCNICFEKSFKANPKSKFWNYELNNNLNPRDVFKSANKKYWFKCNKCGHIFDATLNNIYTHDKWCPYCANHKLCDNNNCCHCFEKSFASHEKASFWCYEKNNNINPRNVFKSANKKYWFKCNKCEHIFDAELRNVNNGKFCPMCVNKTEKIIYEFLLENNFKIIKEAKFEWCKNEETDRSFRFDFVIDNYKLIIEIDGRQHFEEVKHWKNDFKKNQERDKFKMEQAKINNYSIIRIIQEDIYYNKYDWKKELLVNIKKYDNPEMIYMCKNEEYECYPQQ